MTPSTTAETSPTPCGSDLESVPVPASRPAWFAADLHLDGEEFARERFHHLLRLAHAEGADLFLLGDVFHYWFGPKHLRLPMFQRELGLMRAMTHLGVAITIVPGNRDFLLDGAFTRATGAEVSADAETIAVGSERIHLSHGDLFGLADRRYQRMRRVLHSAPVRGLAARLPTAMVNALARRLRQHSEVVVAKKSAEVLAPDLSTVRALIAEDGYDVVICGHFHEVRDELLEGEERCGRFRVLEPFEEHGYYLIRDSHGWSERRLFVDEGA